MKKIVYILTASITAFSMLSCSKEIVETPNQESTQDGHKYITLSVNAIGQTDTKTSVSGTSIIWASSGEKLKVFEDADGTISSSTTKEGETSDGGATMSFKTQLVDKSGEGVSAFNYYALYPNTAYASHSSVTSVAIETAANQTPTATSFDPRADLLIARKVEAGGTQPISLDMAFARMVAIGKMTITNLGTTDNVKSVSISAQADDGSGLKDVVIAGRTAFDLTTALPKTNYGSNVEAKTITLDYSALSLKANSSMDAWFTCFPFALAPGDKLVVAVKTEDNTYTKTVTIPAARELAFTAGKASRFTVNMSGVAAVPNSQDTPFAYLSYEEAVSIGGLTTSYGDYPYTDTYGGGKWQLNAYKNVANSAIQIKSDDASSYIKLPLFEDNIRKIIIKVAASGGSLYFDSAKNVKTGTIYQATNCTAAGEYTYTATNFGTIKTAFIHAVGGTGYISSIEVYAGDDESVQLDTPSNVASVLTDDGAGGTIPNSVTVSWDEVSHADYYVVTLTPTPSGTPIAVRANTNSATIADLAFEKTYTVSVVAQAKNKGLYTASSTGAGSNITTDASPGIAVDDVLFSETWGTYTGDVSDYTFTGTTTYSGVKTSLSYSSDNTSSNVQSGTAGVITSNNFFFYKSAASSLTLAGIPLEGATELTLTYKTNGTNLNVYYKIDNGSEQTLKTGCTKGSNEDSITGISGSATSITLRFYKTGTSNNNRIDDIQLAVASLD